MSARTAPGSAVGVASTRVALVFFVLGVLPQSAWAALGDNDVGMNTHVPNQAFVDASVDLGVNWVRVDGNWNSLEPSDGTYNWGYMDDAVNRATTAGLKVFMTLGYTPDWVPRHGDTDGESYNDVPNESTHWVDFVEAAVTHYRALGVTHFGLWNEANIHFFEGTIAEYASIIVVPGAAAVRNVCGDCLVLGPDFAHVGDVDDKLEELMNAIPGDTWDILTHHLYNGFPELGTDIWDGDRYFEALESQRFPPFSRRGLKQVLDAVGYAGEVWITETGFQADPAGDASREADQATYVVRVLEENLLRAWVTNTFFYEIHDCGIDQPTCTIDGFGLMRATGGMAGNRSFPSDYRLKPAFLALRDFIDTHPEVVGGATALQCGDGLDNDGDGQIDGDDRGCTGAGDDDESDDPPRDEVVAFSGPAPTVDGDLGDFAAASATLGMDDLEVTLYAQWSAQGLHLGVEVIDDTHQNQESPDALWLGDSLQVAFDIGRQGGLAYDAVDDHELNFGLANGTATFYRFHGDAGADGNVDHAIVRNGTTTTYEILLPATALSDVALAEGTRLGFSFLVNENDGGGRIGWKALTPGIGDGKAPEYFADLVLGPATTLPDGGMPPDAGGGSADAGEAPQDSGTSPADSGSGASEGNDSGAGEAPDAGIGNDEGDGDSQPAAGGCGCTTQSPESTALFLATLGLVFFFTRRRKVLP
jgi:MYXO-CTERM domain-containing protein